MLFYFLFFLCQVYFLLEKKMKLHEGKKKKTNKTSSSYGQSKDLQSQCYQNQKENKLKVRTVQLFFMFWVLTNRF